MPSWSTASVIGVLCAVLAAMAAAGLLALWLLHRAQQRQRSTFERLRKQTTQFRRWLDALPFPILIKDQSGNYVWINQASEKELAIPAELVTQHTSSWDSDAPLLIDDSTPAPRLLGRFTELARLDGETRQEIEYLDSTHAIKSGLWWERTVQTAGGQADGTVAVLLDRTPYRQLERETRANEQSLREITQRIPMMIFTLHQAPEQRERRLLFIAGDSEALLGLAYDDFVEHGNVLRGWPFQDRIHPEDVPAVKRLIRQIDDSDDELSLDFRAFGRDGLGWLHLSIVPNTFPDGSRHWTGYFIDATRLNTDNEVLRVARDAAERASKAKADFLSTMSHEIRTPMNGVLGMLELLDHTRLDGEQRELLRAVEDSASVLLQILNDLLDFSKLESGDLRLDVEPFDPRVMVDSALSTIAAQAQKKGLELRVDIDPAVAASLRGDNLRLRQILLNLLGNAIKFTERGHIDVHIIVLGDDEVSQRIRLTISDTGIGIPEDKQDRLFTPFAQAESSTARHFGGTGLGLAICRQLAHLMDGTIELQSQPEKGTHVILDLRLPVERRALEIPSTLRSRRAVIRVASRSLADSLAHYLSALGVSSEYVPPEQPLRAGMSAQLLFLDESLLGATQPLAAAIIALSARADAPSLQTMGEHLLMNAQPLKWQTLLRACVAALTPGLEPSADEVITPAATPALTTAPSSQPSAMPRHASKPILVAEDHPVSQQLIRRQLELLGYPSQIVANGEEALRSLERGNYSLLLTDCHMPGMDGYTLASRWREHERSDPSGTHLPILAMTANAMPEDVARCSQAGMDDHLGKPLRLRALKEKIEHWLAHDQGNFARPQQDPPPMEGMLASDGFSVDDFMRQTMYTSGCTDIDAMRQAVHDANIGQAIEHLHRLLGALPLFTQDPLLDEGRALLSRLQGDNPQPALDRLITYTQSIEQLLQRLTSPTIERR